MWPPEEQAHTAYSFFFKLLFGQIRSLKECSRVTSASQQKKRKPWEWLPSRQQMGGRARMTLTHTLTWSISWIMAKRKGYGHHEPEGFSKSQTCTVPATATAILNSSAKIQRSLHKVVGRWAEQCPSWTHPWQTEATPGIYKDRN